MKRRVYLAQVNYLFGENAFLPYSVGRLWAYAKQFEDITDHFELGELLFLREPVADAVARMERPDVLGVSCYIWNREWNRKLIAAVRESFPDCLIVVGGPEVPDSGPPGFLGSDVTVHGEGEEFFADILRHRRTDYTMPAAFGPKRIADPGKLPSPYLSGVFDDLMPLPYVWQASQETHRGCPYKCTFCDWGSATFTKVRRMEQPQIEEELSWFAWNQIELVYNCDANFGMLKQDIETARHMVTLKEATGYPKKFRAAWAKKHTPQIFEMADMLTKAGLQKGVTIGLQSLDPGVLTNIKRKNIAVDDLPGLIERYHGREIPTYAELILGMPGETLETFAAGLDALLEAGHHESISVYNCMMLVNSELSKDRASFGLETVTIPMLVNHGREDETDETYEIIIGTQDMPHEQWREAWLLAWAVMTFHCLGPTQYIARVLHDRLGVKYTDFYRELLLGAKPEGVIWGEKKRSITTLDKALAGRGWDTRIASFGDVTWPPEEASFLRLSLDKDWLYRELRTFLRLIYDGIVEDSWLCAIVDIQKARMLDPYSPRERELEGGVYVAPDEYGGDLERFAREAVWYGRKGGSMLAKLEMT